MSISQIQQGPDWSLTLLALPLIFLGLKNGKDNARVHAVQRKSDEKLALVTHTCCCTGTPRSFLQRTSGSLASVYKSLSTPSCA